MRRISAVTIAAAATLVGAARLDAHKPVTSKYTYTRDVLPIVREKCGACHRPGGAAPMSLLTYEEAFPWAESIRAELIAGHMPPAAADPTFGAIAHNRILTAQETDVILTWATGGNPKGGDTPAAAADGAATWTLGTPDVVLTLPDTVTLAADKGDDTRDFVLKVPAGAHRVRAIDVRPGAAAVVRNVTVSIKQNGPPPGTAAIDPVLCRWVPGEVPTDLSKRGAAFALPSGAELDVRIHYKKTWQYDGKVVEDQTAIGLYFANVDTRPLAAIVLDAAKPIAPGGDMQFSVAIDHNVDVFAVRVDQVPADELVEVEDIQPSGQVVPFVRFTGQPNWERRYWFSEPVPVMQGSRIQVHAAYRNPALVADAFGGVSTSATATATPTLRLALDVANRR